MSLHYAWCTQHVGHDGFDFCEHERQVGGVRVEISAGSVNDVPSVNVYSEDAWLSADEARALAGALIEAADALESSPLPNVSHADA